MNVSPKGIDCFRVLSPHRVGYMDLVGSGNETSAHLLENGRITFMFCAFNGPPNILRLYGDGRTVLPRAASWQSVDGGAECQAKHLPMSAIRGTLPPGIAQEPRRRETVCRSA